MGCCTACAVRVVSGHLHQPQALGVSEGLRRQGFALMCVAYPRSDAVLETVEVRGEGAAGTWIRVQGLTLQDEAEALRPASSGAACGPWRTVGLHARSALAPPADTTRCARLGKMGA